MKHEGEAMNTQFLFTHDHPVFQNHKVYGTALLPGMAYIDLLFQIFLERGFELAELELRHLSLHNPLTVDADAAILVDVRCSAKRPDCWELRVTGRARRAGLLAADVRTYVTAEMVRREPTTFDKTIDIESLKATASSVRPLNRIYERSRELELVHSGMMVADGTIYEAESGLLLDLGLGPEGLADAEAFCLHPTLIDASGVGSAALFFPLLGGEERLFLPLFFQSFAVAEPIRRRCLTTIDRDAIRLEKELMTQSWEFFDPSGRKIAELRHFVNKLVREPGLINPGRKAEAYDSEPAEATVVAESATLDADETAPAERPSQAGRDAVKRAERYLQEVLAERLGRAPDAIDPAIGYYQMGLDSSRLLHIVSRLSDDLQSELSPILLFEYTNVAELAAFLAEHHGERFGGRAEQAEQGGEVASRPPAAAEIVAPPPGDHTATGDVAVIGLAGRYPKARDIRAFWRNLVAGLDCIEEIPADRWDWRRLMAIKSPSGKPMCRWGGFLEDIDKFDPLFFNMAPSHAEIIDPQERLFLQTCWEAIEDAGYTPANLVASHGAARRRHVGVYVGCMHKDYSLVGLDAIAGDNVFPLSLNYAQIANRVSYTFNFHGPSMAIDTVCSSSLTALHLALESLRTGEAEVALAGGVNLSLHPTKYVAYGTADMHASDGRCRTFGAGGDGYVPAEGVGAVLLKPLARAEADGDHIYAVIKGSTVNHVGTVSGISVPSPVAQAEMVSACLAKTGIDPRTISYVEAHGTGTSLGDPIEIQGLVKAFRRHTADRGFCAIGSVKSNIGHAEAAAGISGLSKVVLQLHHRTLVPSLHSRDLNPYIDFENSPFVVQQETRPWAAPEPGSADAPQPSPRRAAISSFGAGGANAHVILEEYRRPARPSLPSQVGAANEAALVVLSAKDARGLLASAANLLAFLKTEVRDQAPSADVDDLAILLGEVLGVDPGDIDPQVPLADFGLDPVQQSEFRRLLSERLGIEIEAHEVLALEPLARIGAAAGAGQEEIQIEGDPPTLRDVAYTLQVGREAMDLRFGVAVRDLDELAAALEAFVARGVDAEAGDEAYRFGAVKRENGSLALFEADAAQKASIEEGLERGDLAPLLELWIEGLVFDWAGLYGDSKPRRVSLPTYPFARDRYWVPQPAHPAPAEARYVTPSIPPFADVAAPGSAARIERSSAGSTQWLFFEERWLPRTYPESIDWAAALRRYDGRRVLILHDDEAAAAALRGLLDRMAQAVGLTLGLDLQVRHLAELAAHDLRDLPDAVLILGPVTADRDVAPADEARLLDVFRVSQLLMQEAWAQPIRLLYLYGGSRERPRLDCEALSGFMMSAMKENPKHHWTLVGHYDREARPNAHQLLLREWLADSELEPEAGAMCHVRVEEGQTRTVRLAPAELELGARSNLRRRGTYLVSGGLGPVGALLCRELARHCQANLIILSRGELDEARAETCRELEDLGATVHYLAVDVSDREALTQAVTAAKAAMGAIHGVIHLARLVEDGPIIAKQPESIHRVVQAKMRGTLLLDEATADEPLDFFLAFSSVGAYGTRGSCDYGYATAFQNAFAVHRNRLRDKGLRSGTTVSQCWGAWTVDRYMPEGRDAHMRGLGLDLIRIEDAFPVMDAAARFDGGVLGLVAVTDLEKVARGMGLLGYDAVASSAAVSRLEARLARWERDVADGRAPRIEELNDVLTVEELEALEPQWIERLHAVFFPDRPAPAEDRVVERRQAETEPATSETARTVPERPAVGSSPQAGPIAGDATTGGGQTRTPSRETAPVRETSTARPATATAEPDPDDVAGTMRVIRETLSEVLKLSQVDERQSFQNYGLDSISGMQFSTRLEKKLKCEVQPQWLLEFSTVETLSQHLVKHQATR
ncbi:SDR family NAD(P)-dependent oxidoreductase [Sulfidibacter corallicola]|uniref:SDR family NAD(P)-dependent oxidoreductase n=1 Tax=Sulfidibacter corallicola TaxID=2818388 RepID=A0A8A4TJN4_SULCO|nr:SDR family NAD(P)-dependent oxidoreductase [Sulfidibacter corallicola]QTD50239.1 SDR family NAD(P)-dependent oxidoreductase [Sulfidibacter corallicola]